MDWKVQLSCPVNGGLYPRGIGRGGDEADHGTMFCKEMSHVNHGNGVALRHERNQDEMWLWSIISDIHGYLFGLDSNTAMEKKLVPLNKYMNCFSR